MVLYMSVYFWVSKKPENNEFSMFLDCVQHTFAEFFCERNLILFPYTVSFSEGRRLRNPGALPLGAQSPHRGKSARKEEREKC